VEIAEVSLLWGKAAGTGLFDFQLSDFKLPFLRPFGRDDRIYLRIDCCRWSTGTILVDFGWGCNRAIGSQLSTEPLVIVEI
jgi:hypothetical protein